jgi:hypothetical protein
LSFGRVSWLTDVPITNQEDWRDRRTPWSHQIARGPYRLDIEQPFTPRTGADANTDLLYLTVNFGGLNHPVMFEHRWGRNGRYGTMWELQSWPYGSEIHSYGNYGGAVYQTATSGRPTVAYSTNTISFTLTSRSRSTSKPSACEGTFAGRTAAITAGPTGPGSPPAPYRTGSTGRRRTPTR